MASGQAFDANSDLPILGASVGIYNGNDPAETTSEEDAAPIRTRRRARAAPILLSSDEESEPYTPTKRRRDDQKLRKRSQIALDVNQTLSDSAPLPGAGSSGENCANGAESSETVSKAGNALVISSGAEGDLSEDEVVTPMRRRRSTATFVAAASKTNDFQQIDSEDLDDEVADLDDTGRSQFNYSASSVHIIYLMLADIC